MNPLVLWLPGTLLFVLGAPFAGVVDRPANEADERRDREREDDRDAAAGLSAQARDGPLPSNAASWRSVRVTRRHRADCLTAGRFPPRK